MSFVGDKEHTQDDLPANSEIVNTADGGLAAWMFNATAPFLLTSAASTDGADRNTNVFSCYTWGYWCALTEVFVRPLRVAAS